MTVDVKVPVLAESIPDATLLEWRKQPGDVVEKDEILIELETDKVVLEVPAPASGVLTEALRQTGDTVLSGEVLARIDASASVAAMPSGSEPALTLDSPPAISDAAPGLGDSTAPTAAPTPAADPGRLSPAVRRLVDEHGLDASIISGTGRDGRITKGDMLAHLEATATPTAPAPAEPSTAQIESSPPRIESASVRDGPSSARAERAPAESAPASGATAPALTGPTHTPVRAAPAEPAAPPAHVVSVSATTAPGHRAERREPMSRLRRRIAERLVEAQHTAAILTTFNEIDMQPVIALRARHKEGFERRHGVRLGFMSFFAKAAVRALQRFPAVNARIEDGDIVYQDYCDIGVAVGSPRGLVVPILRNVEAMSFAGIEAKIAEFGTKARDGSLSIGEMSGGTFTISNGGVFGSLLSTPILNPPQSGILGMHKTEERPVVQNGEVVVRPMMYVALSYDHRIIDGREAVQFLVCVKEAIEDPARLLLDV